MPSEIYVLLGTIIGALIPIIGSMNIEKRKEKIEFKKIQLEIMNKEKESDEKKRNEKIIASEEIIEKLQKLSFEYSKTKQYMREVTLGNSFDAHRNYEENLTLLYRIEILITKYFPDGYDIWSELSGLINRMWGIQQNYFGYSWNNMENHKFLQPQFEELYEPISNNIGLLKRLVIVK